MLFFIVGRLSIKVFASLSIKNQWNKLNLLKILKCKD